MDRSLDRHEQYCRTNCLLIHGFKENKKEDTDEFIIEIFEKEMQEKVSVNDIDRSHRLGKEHIGSSPRPIIIKFPSTMAVMLLLDVLQIFRFLMLLLV